MQKKSLFQNIIFSGLCFSFICFSQANCMNKKLFSSMKKMSKMSDETVWKGFEKGFGFLVKSRTDEGKLHLGEMLTLFATDCTIYNFCHDDAPEDIYVAIDRITDLMNDVLPEHEGESLSSASSSYFCEQFPGLDDAILDAENAARTLWDDFYNKKCLPKVYIDYLIKKVGNDYFGIPQDTDINDDAYFFEVKNYSVSDTVPPEINALELEMLKWQVEKALGRLGDI